MLKAYAPEMDEKILDRLVATFAELRNMADQGQTPYPYSTREAVAIVKHLQKYPDEGIQVNMIILQLFQKKNVFKFVFPKGVKMLDQNFDIFSKKKTIV